MHMPHYNMHMPSHAQTGHTTRTRPPHRQPTPLTPTSSNVIQFIGFTYCNDVFPHATYNEKIAKYNPLIPSLKSIVWQVNPLITITYGYRGFNRDEQPIKDLGKLKILKNDTKRLVKHLLQIAIKYLTDLIINKRELPPSVDPP